MKSIKDTFSAVLAEASKNSYDVGDNIQFNLDDVAKANPGKEINDDSGKIIKVTSGGYVVKSHLDGTEFKVSQKHAISFGSAGADGQV